MELGKAPLGKKWTKAGVTLDKAVAHMNQGKNVGALIPPNWAVYDIDPRNFPEGRNVEVEFQAAMGLKFEELPLVRTGSGGRHYFTRLPVGYKGAVKHPDFPGVEFKQIGAQVVTAGSIHPKTRGHYKWMDVPKTLIEAPEAPKSVLELYRLKAPTLSTATGAGSWNSLTEKQIEDALKLLAPETFRDQDAWFGLMCSVHWLSGGEARELWIEWSTGDPPYEDHREIIEMRWDSLGRDSDSNQIVAKGGLLFKALKAVGENPAHQKWQVQPEKDFDDYDADEASSDSNQIRLVVEEATDKAVKTEGGIIGAMNKRHFVLDHKGKTVVGRIRHDEDDHGATIRVYTFSDVTSFKNYYANQTVKSGADTVQIAEWWFHHPSRLTYSKMEFRPDRTAGAYRDNEGLVLNQWTGWAIQPKPGNWDLFKELIDSTICGDDVAKIEYIYKWLATAYQKMDSPIGTALAVNGLKGTGKTTFWEVFSAPFGTNHSMSTSRMEEVFGNFNGRMMGKAALLIEEALFAASKQANAILKDVITGARISINEKFLPSYAQKSFMRVLIFTNSDHIVEATEDERRFFVTKALPNKKYNKDFWIALRKQMFEDGGVAAFFHDMLQIDITGFDTFADLPRTKELIEQISITRGATIDWLTEKFDFGEGQFAYAWHNKKGDFILPINEMWEDFAIWQKQRAHGRYDNPIRSQSGFSRELKRIFAAENGRDELPLTTASVPDSMSFEIKSYAEKNPNGRTYNIAKVYKFPSFDSFHSEFRRRYGTDVPKYNPEDDEEDEPDFSTPYEDADWDIL